jgi:hypothetical protein
VLFQKGKRFRLSAVEDINPEIAEIAAEVRQVVQGRVLPLAARHGMIAR